MNFWQMRVFLAVFRPDGLLQNRVELALNFPNVSNMHIMRSKLASHYIPSYQVYHILCVYDVYHRAIYPIRTIYPLHSLVHELRFDIGKSSTASWLQCSGNRCPVGRCSPAPQWRDPQSSAEEVTGFQQIYDD